MSHPFPCPKCNYSATPVWKVHVHLGRGECTSCGYTLDASIIRSKVLEGKMSTERYCTHRWAQSGMVRSWCAKCSVVGQFNTETGKYEVIKP